MTASKTIISNTLYLYIRMFFATGVTLYTSGIVLNILGVEDFGIYNIVGGIVALFGFLNGAMSSATQRYLSFDIGKNDSIRLCKTFNSTFIIHIGIALFILFFAETIGLWYVNNYLNVPLERMRAVNWVYQFSVLTTLVGVIQVPFNSLIIARERMFFFAAISVFDVLAKLIAVYLLLALDFDKLILYSFFVFFISISTFLSYRIYCNINFIETKFKLSKDIPYYKELLFYSGWNLFGGVAAVSKGQGINLILNFFFGTVVNAAYGITLQVQSAVNMFANNFQFAVNPQIIKNYSKGNRDRVLNLIFQSAKFSFFLVLLVASPILINTEYILAIWLKTAPDHSVVFIQLCLMNVLIDCISSPVMIGVQATGKIKWYQIVVGVLVFVNLPISFFVLSLSGAPQDVFIVGIIVSLFTLHLRLIFFKRVFYFEIRRFYIQVIFRISIVILFFLLFFYLFKAQYSPPSTFILFLIQSISIVLVLLLLILIFGVSKAEIQLIHKFFKKSAIK